MRFKSSLIMLVTSAAMLAPVVTTGLTAVSADTVAPDVTQVSTRNITISPTKGVVTVTSNFAHFYKDNLEMVPDCGVYYQSSWKTDKIAYNSSTGEEFFRIAPNKWLSASDVVFSY